jgi:O-antigen ligase
MPSGGASFSIYIAYLAFTFLNVPSRIPALGLIRPTVVFVAILALACLLNLEKTSERLRGPTTKWLTVLLIYILVTLPFVQWPGSVLRLNLEIFVRSIAFYFFTVALVDTPSRLRVFVLSFVSLQVFRAMEPLWLHLTEGYWGSWTHLGGGELMDRLSGAPADVINPNGLAYVVVTVIPFLHFWALSNRTFAKTLVYIALAPLLIYTLILSQSRSGMVALAIVVMGVLYFSRQRAAVVGVIVIAAMLVIPTLGPNQLARYQSLYRSDVAGADTAAGRISGIETDLAVAAKRPIFGYGLGTSLEANYNEAGATHLSHNLYTETLIELGAVGLFIFGAYLLATWRNARDVLRNISGSATSEERLGAQLVWLPKALLVWMAMSLVFGLASYGLSEYQWYLFGGLTVVTLRMLRSEPGVPEPARARVRNRTAFRGQRARGLIEGHAPVSGAPGPAGPAPESNPTPKDSASPRRGSLARR